MATGSLDTLFEGVRAGQRASIGRAITLLESRNKAHYRDAHTLLSRLMPYTGRAQRVGISGVPGVGKSTFIESLGLYLIAAGRRVAVLAVDPTSSLTGGSILGDKTRMERLSVQEGAFIRPSPSSGVLGGVGRATMETILLLEAAGYDTLLVETVGTGQSETMVADMVDFFMVLMLPGAGDDLQGIKKGILELADMIVVNKSDVFQDKLINAVRDYKSALRILAKHDMLWQPQVLSASGLTGQGLPEVWETVSRHARIMKDQTAFDAKRQKQRLLWFKRLLNDRLLETLLARPEIEKLYAEQRERVLKGEILPSDAAEVLISLAIGNG